MHPKIQMNGRQTVRKRTSGPGRVLRFSPRDNLILRFIWNWKVASSQSIHTAIGAEGSPYSTYKTLVRLEKLGFLESRHHLTQGFHVWCLSKLGFESIRDSLGDLKEEGYQSENHPHDRLVLAFQLGDWARYRFPQVKFFTEQDLRRREMEDYPDWVPRSVEHRADGYTRVVGAAKPVTFAYEIELSAKSVQKYEACIRFYQSFEMVERVIWLVGSTEILDTILRAKSRMNDDSTNFHVFVLLDNFLKNGWDASVLNERSVMLFTLRENYRRTCGELIGALMGNFRGPTAVTDHLVNQKVIGKTRSSLSLNPGT